MIERTYIYDSDTETALANLAEYLEKNAVPRYFTKIESSEGIISCYINDLEFLKIGYPLSTAGVTICTNNNTSLNIATGSGSTLRFEYAYSCSHGLMFKVQNSSDYPFAFAITKDDSENTTIIVENKLYTFASSSSSTTMYILNSNSGEISPFRVVRYKSLSFAKTTLAPLVVSGGAGNYTPNAFLQLFEHNTEQGSLEVNGERYFSNGLWCIKDE